MTITFDARRDARAVTGLRARGRHRAPAARDAEEQPLDPRDAHALPRALGHPVVINTSFNMHEEPIVCTPDEAVERSSRRTSTHWRSGTTS